jgi:hypothetical protein
MSYVATLHLYRIKLGTKLVRSLRPLWLGQGRSLYKGAWGVLREEGYRVLVSDNPGVGPPPMHMPTPSHDTHTAQARENSAGSRPNVDSWLFPMQPGPASSSVARPQGPSLRSIGGGGDGYLRSGPRADHGR